MIRSMLIAVVLAGGSLAVYLSTRADASACCDPTGLATCSGAVPCKACKDCSKCNYCHVKGGYCGVCSKPAKPD